MLLSRATLTASSLADTDAITCDGHGLETDSPITVRTLDGGSLPAPLVAGTTYYARRLSNRAFEIAAAPSGPAIDLTTDSFTMVVEQEPDFDRWINRYSRWVDLSLSGQVLPLGETEPVHPVIATIVAEMVAARLYVLSGQKTTDDLDKIEVRSLAILARFVAGLPLRGAPTTSSANLAITSTPGSAADPRGWGSGSLP